MRGRAFSHDLNSFGPNQSIGRVLAGGSQGVREEVRRVGAEIQY